MFQSKNSLCDCGSGKKYKRCCFNGAAFDTNLDQLNANYRLEIKKSPMWKKVVNEFGEVEAEKLLQQISFRDAGAPLPKGIVAL